MALLPINKIEKVSKKRIQNQQLDIYKDSISGDAIKGGRITDFASTGIQDQASFPRLIVFSETVATWPCMSVIHGGSVKARKVVETAHSCPSASSCLRF